mmetsp:Transcript_52045/g.59026  ORF Transcript_52045/g.59026 Transcript_52045/m.59026 type:complete len:323 (-) Transcript_52045:172-1140(-)
MKQLLIHDKNHRRRCDGRFIQIYLLLLLFIGNLIRQNHSFTFTSPPTVITSSCLPLHLQQHCCSVVVTGNSRGPSFRFPLATSRLPRAQKSTVTSLMLSIHDTSSSSSSSGENKAASRWDHMFNLLTVYKKREKHCNVPRLHTEKEKDLGTWLSTQRGRRKKGILTRDRKSQLENLGVVWEINSTTSWEDMFTLLVQYQNREGNCHNVPQTHIEEGENLGIWLSNQRQNKRKGTLTADRTRQLNDLDVVWVVNSTKSWNEMCTLLQEFKDREGHCNVPQSHVEEGENLGVWLRNKRHIKKKGEMGNEKIQQLENLGVVWKVR